MKATSSSPSFPDTTSSWARRGPLLLGALASLATAAPSVARADDDAIAAARAAMWDHAVNARHWVELGDQTRLEDSDITACRAAVAAGTKAGVKPTDMVELVGKNLLWRNVGTICDELVGALAFERVNLAVGKTIQTGLRHDDDPNLMANMQPYAKECLVVVDRAIADGLPTDHKFTVGPQGNQQVVTLSEARAACADIVDRGGKIAAAAQAIKDAEVAALKARWVKLGAKGDRLEFLMNRDNIELRGKGCRILADKARVSAAVLYQVNEDDSYWYVWKTTFKKDRLLGSDSRQYSKITQQWRCW